MKDSEYEQLSRKERMTRTSTHQTREQEEELQLAEEHRIAASTRPKSTEVEQKKGNPILKTIFWMLRKLIAPIIMIIMLAAGLYVGYVVIADQPSDEVFKFETWKHLWDLIFADS